MSKEVSSVSQDVRINVDKKDEDLSGSIFSASKLPIQIINNIEMILYYNLTV